jgi:hypothetical protein
MNWLGRRGRLLAVAGIVIFVLSLLSSSEKTPGVPATPFVIVLFARTAMLAFIVTATVFLWNKARTLALVFAGMNLLQILGFVQALAQDTWQGIPLLVVHAVLMPPALPGLHGLAGVIAGLAAHVAELVLYIWVIVKLFMRTAPRPVLPADALRKEPMARGLPGKGAMLGGLGAFLTIVLVILSAVVVRAGRVSRTPLVKHPALRGMYAVQGSLESWAKQNGGAYPYAAEFDSDSSRFMKFLARDRVG